MKDNDPINQTTIYDVTKRLDPTRPVIDASGGIHYISDMYDVHDYTQDPVRLAEKLAPMIDDPNYIHNPLHNPQLKKNVYIEGQPYWISEYGGIMWGNDGWGYGHKVADLDEFLYRFEGQTRVLLEHPRICGFCYTQLTDVEQEQNGLFYYDRSKKFSEEIYDRIRAALTGPAAIEKNNK